MEQRVIKIIELSWVINSCTIPLIDKLSDNKILGVIEDVVIDIYNQLFKMLCGTVSYRSLLSEFNKRNKYLYSAIKR